MKALKTKQKRRLRVRRKIIGTTERPRMCIFRSLRYMYVQIIDDINSKTIISAATICKDFKERFQEHKNNKKAAGFLGEFIAEKALEKGIKKVVFDRGCYKYHGRLQVLADAARKKGLEF